MSGPGDARARPLPGELARLLHDVRGPLNSAVMHLEVVKRVVAGTGRGAESLDIALDQLTRLAALLPSAFEVVAHDLGAREAVDLHAVAVQAVAQHPGATVHVAPGPWPAVLGDARLLTIAVAHLVGNALEASAGREAGPPEVGAVAVGHRVVLSVRDRGPGLRSTNARLLIRLGQSTKSGHRGLGLLTVERIARLHGGHLAFESPGEGARVSLHLPGA